MAAEDVPKNKASKHSQISSSGRVSSVIKTIANIQSRGMLRVMQIGWVVIHNTEKRNLLPSDLLPRYETPIAVPKQGSSLSCIKYNRGQGAFIRPTIVNKDILKHSDKI